MATQPAVGTFICYQPKDFTKAHMEIIAKVNHIIEPYEAGGQLVTVRQVYYQMVHRNWLANKTTEYQRLIGILTDARMAGLVSWTAFEDRNRALMGINTVDGPPEAFNKMLRNYAIDMWANQDWRPEVWIEKKSLVGVISNACNRQRVDYFATAGYSSVTETWAAGQRFGRYIAKGQRPIVFYLGDHDPSGIDMTRHVRDTLTQFVGQPIIVQRLALNRDQIDEHGFPENPTKLSDSRAEAYIAEHGYASWELDAMPIPLVEDMIHSALLSIRDEDRWDEMMEEETTDKRVMQEMVASHFPDPNKEDE